ncbi:hypothetical protein Tco_1407649 [Tanacetum coccineum]
MLPYGLREEMGGAEFELRYIVNGVQARLVRCVEVYEVGLRVWLWLLAVVAYLGKRRAMWPLLMTKRRSKLLGPVFQSKLEIDILPQHSLRFPQHTFDVIPAGHAQPKDIQELLLKDLQIIREELTEYINCPSWNRPALYDDDDDDEYTIQYREYLENSSKVITPDLPTEEPDNSLSIGDEHLDTIPEMESDEQLLYDNSPPLDALKDPFEIFSNFNDDSTSSDDDSFAGIDYVEASPPDSELVSLEKVKDNLLREKLLNINLLIAKIESLNNNSILDCVFKSPIPVKDIDSFFEKPNTSLSYSDKSLPEFETFSDYTEETSSGSTTTHADNSLPKELYVHVPNVLPTLPTLEDRHYLFLTYVIRSFLPYFTYPMEYPFLLSSGSEDTIFDPGISDFHFSSLEPAASHRSGTFICFNVYPNILNISPMKICSSTSFVPNITMI